MCFEKGGASCREIVEGGVVHQSSKAYFIKNFSSIVINKETRNTTDCQCKICAIPRQKGTLSSSSQVIGRPKHESQAFPSPMPIKVCQRCYNIIGKGLSHVCNITEKREYLIAAINKGKDIFNTIF